MADNQYDRIRQRAHDLWEQDGTPEGSGERYWSQAQEEITESGAGAAGTVGAPVTQTGDPEMVDDQPLVMSKAQ